MTLGDKIRKAREHKNLTQRQLADLIGAKHNSISNWENDQNKPDISYIELMSGVLGVDPSYFFDNKQTNYEVFSFTELSHIKKYRKLSRDGKKVIDKTLDCFLDYEKSLMRKYAENCKQEFSQELSFRYIDLPELPASAGTGEFLDTCYCQALKIPVNEKTNKADFLIRVSGNSMEPQFNDGDIVLVKEMPSINTGDFGIFILNGEMLLKQMGRGELISLNENYPPRKINEFDSFFCRGKVIGKL